jgi:hypothetical protein
VPGLSQCRPSQELHLDWQLGSNRIDRLPAMLPPRHSRRLVEISKAPAKLHSISLAEPGLHNPSEPEEGLATAGSIPPAHGQRT